MSRKSKRRFHDIGDLDPGKRQAGGIESGVKSTSERGSCQENTRHPARRLQRYTMRPCVRRRGRAGVTIVQRTSASFKSVLADRSRRTPCKRSATKASTRIRIGHYTDPLRQGADDSVLSLLHCGSGPIFARTTSDILKHVLWCAIRADIFAVDIGECEADERSTVGRILMAIV